MNTRPLKSSPQLRSLSLCTLFLFGLLLSFTKCYAKDDQILGYGSTIHPKSNKVPMLYVNSGTDFTSDTLSADAVQLAEQLNIKDKLKILDQLREQIKTETPSLEKRVEFLELKEDITEILEKARMEVDYVRAALAAEGSMQGELHRSYQADRDNRVLQNNIWSFRTNGILWTLAEALSIPTYSHPRYSVSSGTLGILAGLVPTAFSIVAVRESQGGKFNREKAPNMFAKVFDYPVVPAVDYPKEVLDFLNAVPAHNKFGKTRMNLLIDQWQEDKNIHILSDRHNKSQLDLLTGSTDQHLTVDLLGDRVSMLAQLDALVSLMNRPLFELMLVVRGSKHIPSGN